jgi:hypothetical protein
MATPEVLTESPEVGIAEPAATFHTLIVQVQPAPGLGLLIPWLQGLRRVVIDVHAALDAPTDAVAHERPDDGHVFGGKGAEDEAGARDSGYVGHRYSCGFFACSR